MHQHDQSRKADPPRAVALPPTASPHTGTHSHTLSQPNYHTNSHISNEEPDELEQMLLEEISKTER